MSKIILGISLDIRSESATAMQALLTQYGCYIRTRLGMHQEADVSCTEKGIVILEMIKNADDHVESLKQELSALNGVTVKEMRFN